MLFNLLHYQLQSKTLEPGPLLPSTSMAAHAVEEDAEIELENNNGVTKTPSRVEKGTTNESMGLPFPLPPPPPILKNNHSQVYTVFCS